MCPMHNAFPASAVALIPLADLFADHHGWDDGWWIVMAVGMLIFWAAVVIGVIWLVRELSSRRRSSENGPTALEVLDRRLAEGAISIEEYRERRRALLEPDDRRHDDG